MDKQLMINALIIQIKQLLNFPAKKKAGKAIKFEILSVKK